MKLKIDPLSLLAGLLMLGSIFVPWMRSADWSLGMTGSLVELTAKSFVEMASLHTGELFISSLFFQMVGVLGCMVFLVVGGGLVLLQVREDLVFVGAVFGVVGLLLFSLVTLNFLQDVSVVAIGGGYVMGWIGAVLAGIVGEHR